jgi:hypothetical protein
MAASRSVLECLKTGALLFPYFPISRQFPGRTRRGLLAFHVHTNQFARRWVSRCRNFAVAPEAPFLIFVPSLILGRVAFYRHSCLSLP